ncbi:hypothetical protein WICMUC_001872 [Wickerhamomyces mucosus]|uniref:Uncharacterized protein n=1 Tax=Wickerhamomyces mucosus TaxID=1378264 RepID=A0A9P8PRR7_9ASCO|nr:hypothetical protein WICMUC_001872 [Wickerhamomyces mucosus]
MSAIDFTKLPAELWVENVKHVPFMERDMIRSKLPELNPLLDKDEIILRVVHIDQSIPSSVQRLLSSNPNVMYLVLKEELSRNINETHAQMKILSKAIKDPANINKILTIEYAVDVEDSYSSWRGSDVYSSIYEHIIGIRHCFKIFRTPTDRFPTIDINKGLPLSECVVDLVFAPEDLQTDARLMMVKSKTQDGSKYGMEVIEDDSQIGNHIDFDSYIGFYDFSRYFYKYSIDGKTISKEERNAGIKRDLVYIELICENLGVDYPKFCNDPLITRLRMEARCNRKLPVAIWRQSGKN